MHRVIPLDGVRNFRMFGGYAGADGALVRGGLYRSGHFARASATDRSRIEALGVSVVADLRRPAERMREPSPWAGDRPRVIASDHEGAAEPPHLIFLREGDVSAAGMRGYMLSAYKRLPFEAGNKHVFAEGLRAIAASEPDESFVVHCAAGKDRTGIFCALALAVAGVDRDTIYDDYLLTNRAVDYAEIAPAIADQIEAAFGRKIAEADMTVFLGVEADYLDAAWREMGDPIRYMQDVLGLAPAEIASVREALLRP